MTVTTPYAEFHRELLASLRVCTRAEFRYAVRVQRLVEHHRADGYDPEDCVVIDPRSGAPKRLILTQEISWQASEAARMALAGNLDRIANRQPGAVALAAEMFRERDIMLAEIMHQTSAACFLADAGYVQ